MSYSPILLARCRFDDCCFLYSHVLPMCRIYILRVATCSGEDEGLLEYINRYGSPFDK